MNCRSTSFHVVALLCAFFPRAVGLKYNIDVADVVIAFETVYRGPDQQTPGNVQVQGIGALASWIQQIATQLPLGPEKMRLAVAMVDSYYVTSLVTLNDGVSADRVAAAMASYASSTAIQFVQPMQEGSLVPSVRQTLQQGDRPNAPNLIIMVILHSTYHPQYQTIFQSASWQGAEMLIVMHEYARPWHVVPYDVVNRKFVASTAVMIDQSVPLIVNTLQEILRSCPYEDGSSVCFYDQSGKCVEKTAKTMRPVGDQKYCLGSTGSSTIDCKKSKAECDRKCKEFENSLDWGTCSVTCGTGQQTATMKTTEPKEHYAHCQNLKYTKPCTMQPCGGTKRPATTPRKGPSRRTTSRKSPGTKYGTGMTQKTHDAPVRGRTTNRGKEKAEGTPTWLIAVIATVVSLAVIIGIVLVVCFVTSSRRRRRRQLHYHFCGKMHGKHHTATCSKAHTWKTAGSTAPYSTTTTAATAGATTAGRWTERGRTQSHTRSRAPTTTRRYYTTGTTGTKGHTTTTRGHTTATTGHTATTGYTATTGRTTGTRGDTTASTGYTAGPYHTEGPQRGRTGHARKSAASHLKKQQPHASRSRSRSVIKKTQHTKRPRYISLAKT